MIPEIEATDGAANKILSNNDFMILITLGLIVFTLGFWMRGRYKRDEHHAGIKGMNAVLVAAAVLTIFYGVIGKMVIH